jgi:ubiquinone biosynthesis protein
VGRLGTLLIADPRRRRARVAELQGKTLRAAMAFLGACFVKLGQVMSSRPDLFEPEMIAELRHLQDRLPPFPFSVVKQTLERDLGKPVGDVFADFEEEPIAAASVAQVHRAHLKGGQEVAVKVLRPNVRAQVERDGALLLMGAKLMNLHPMIRLSDPVGFTQSFVDGLVNQTDLRGEGANYDKFRENFKNENRVAFPEVFHELTTERVLVMDFVRGQKLDRLGEGDHSQIATALREAAFKMCLEDGFVHADMHPGNMVKREDGVLVFFDVGLATQMKPNSHEMFVDMTKCIAMGTTDDMVEHFKRYHVYLGDVDWAALRADIDAFSTKFRGRDVSQLDYGDMVNEMLGIGRRYHVRPMSDLALVIVGTVTAQGIGKMLCPQVNDFVEMSKFLIPLLTRRGEKVPDSAEARNARALLDEPLGGPG